MHFELAYIVLSYTLDMSQFLTYSEFHSIQEAQQLIALIRKYQIPFELVQEKGLLDKIYTGEYLDPMVTVKIPEERFEELNALLLSEAKTQLNNIDPDYYLFKFTDQELIDVINNRNEWNYFDQALARKILTDKGIDISKDIKDVAEMDHYSPMHLNTVWIISQYILAVCLSVAGIIIGLATVFAYKTNKSGQKKNIYDDSTRLHGKIILGLGVIRTIYYFRG